MIIESAGVGNPAYSQALPRIPESAGAARHLTASALRVWGLDEAETSAALVVDELVSNAVQHAARNMIRVSVAKTGERLVRIAVVDHSPTFPAPRDAGPGDSSGRGLAIVAALCDGHWGTDRLPWGKRVWAELAIPETKPDE